MCNHIEKEGLFAFLILVLMGGLQLRWRWLGPKNNDWDWHICEEWKNEGSSDAAYDSYRPPHGNLLLVVANPVEGGCQSLGKLRSVECVAMSAVL